jgi:hypothetical protein
MATSRVTEPGPLFDPFFSTDYCPKKEQAKSKIGKGNGSDAHIGFLVTVIVHHVPDNSKSSYLLVGCG